MGAAIPIAAPILPSAERDNGAIDDGTKLVLSRPILGALALRFS
jgi:hypothetical protein